MKYIGILIIFLSIIGCRNDKNAVDISKNNVYIPQPIAAKKFDSMSLWVTGIKDGDSFAALDKDKQPVEVRMLYIDAPERYQPYSIIAKQYNADLIFQDSIKIYYNSRDQYGRILAIVVNSEGKVVNEELLKNGMVWFFDRYSKDTKYRTWQDSTIQNKIGLFQEKDAQPPWEWRKSH